MIWDGRFRSTPVWALDEGGHWESCRVPRAQQDDWRLAGNTGFQLVQDALVFEDSIAV